MNTLKEVHEGIMARRNILHCLRDGCFLKESVITNFGRD